MDKNYNKCNVNALDVDIEHVVAKTLQKYINMLMDSRNIINAQREKKRKSLKLAERHFNMEKSNEKINKDLRDAYESYKLGLTDRETYLEQRKVYEQMILQMQENIEKQKVAVGKMAVADVPEVAGFEMLEGEMKL